MATEKLNIKVGQKWKTKGGFIATIVRNDNHHGYPWDIQIEGEDGERSVTVNGEEFKNISTKYSLKELIEDAPLPVDMVEPADGLPDPDALASETLQGLGWHFDGQCWVQDAEATPPYVHKDVMEHPLFKVYTAAIEQAMYGKGERHGGAITPFLEQPWVKYAKMHGRGFLTGQSAKKLEEAASTRNGQPFEMEVLGAIVYAGMSVLFERGEIK